MQLNMKLKRKNCDRTGIKNCDRTGISNMLYVVPCCSLASNNVLTQISFWSRLLDLLLDIKNIKTNASSNTSTIIGHCFGLCNELCIVFQWNTNLTFPVMERNVSKISLRISVKTFSRSVN